ncbi:MAG: nucleoside hydrolase [Candidatus Bathyarchaeota archaeon]|nr:nucleoside hydrolase [Candidatus Bathyarchaeota archaeon]
MGGCSCEKVPVILDTDIGGDIDDVWALTLMLKSPELDVKLVATDTGNTTYRAKIVAKMLEVAGRTDIPISIGLHLSDRMGRQSAWVEGYDLSSYRGVVHKDGAGAIIDTIMGSPKPITIICIGPIPNVAAALEREPRIAERARFVGMHGCIRKSPEEYGEGTGVVAEYNVRVDPKACQKVFMAPWDVTITPLDTCGFVRLEGKKYRAVRNCADPVVQALIENYGVWLKSRHKRWQKELETRSSILFDTVAIYLAFSEDLLVTEDFGIRVMDDGYTVIDDNAKTVHCATEWKNLSAFESFLVERLAGKQI